MRKSILVSAGMLLGSVLAADQLPEAPELLARDENSTTTSTMWSTSTTWATFTYTLPSSSSPAAYTTDYPTAVSSTSSTTSFSIPLSMLSHSFGPALTDLTTQNLAADVTSTILDTITVLVIAQPVITLYTRSPAWMVNAHPPSSMLEQTNTLEARDVVYDTSRVTIYSTSTAPYISATALWSGPTPPPTTVTHYETMTTAESGLPPGVTVTDVTSVVTVTEVGDSSTQSGDATTSYLNISTFIATGLSTWTYQPASSTSESTSTINTSTLFRDTTLPISTPSASMTDNVGHNGATTVALQLQAPQSGAGQVVDSDGMLVAVAAAMGACVGLALLL